MKTLFISILVCLFILTGCTQQFSNAGEVNRSLSERKNYNIVSSYENTDRRGYDRASLDYGPRIDLGKAIFGK